MSSNKNEIPSFKLPSKHPPKEPNKDKIQVAMIALCGCWGCTLSFLDMDEKIIELLDKVEITRTSLSDIKRIPHRCKIGFIEGGIANEENIETLLHYRENCDILISVGACAVWGGVPSMRNLDSLEACFEEAYINSCTKPPNQEPTLPFHEDLPPITNRVYPCHEVVKMDYFIPGCPPDGAAIYKVLSDLVNGKEPDLPTELTRFD